MSGAAPLRFLAIVIGGWVAVRAAVLVPDWWPPSEAALVPKVAASGGPPIVAPRQVVAPQDTAPFLPIRAPSIRHPGENRGLRTEGRSLSPPPSGFRRDDERADWAVALLEGSNSAGNQLPSPPPLPPIVAVPNRTSFPSRWSVSAWALVRSGDERQLAPGGTLGGSQAGARITYRLSQRLLLSGRAYAPLREPRGAEAALGIEWQPHGALPVRILAERRQALGGDGRSAFAMLAHGGLSEQPVIGPVQLDAYAQAGIVGAKSRDAFIDGAVRLGVPLADDLRIGAGAWGAAQPGAARLDIGPHLSWRLPAPGERVRLSADWRVRIAGNARPGSGPALTLATDF